MSYDFQPLEKAVQEAIAIPASYTDFTDVNPDVLHEIAELEIFLKTKGNGRAFREAVIQLFKRYILTVSSQGNANMEVSAARGIFTNLKERLDNLDLNDDELEDAIELLKTQFSTLVASSGSGSSSEVTDIRVAYDNAIYPTAGDAVRKQFTQMDDKISLLNGTIDTAIDAGIAKYDYGITNISTIDTSTMASTINGPAQAYESKFVFTEDMLVTGITIDSRITSTSFSIFVLDSTKKVIDSILNYNPTISSNRFSLSRNLEVPKGGHLMVRFLNGALFYDRLSTNDYIEYRQGDGTVVASPIVAAYNVEYKKKVITFNTDALSTDQVLTLSDYILPKFEEISGEYYLQGRWFKKSDGTTTYDATNNQGSLIYCKVNGASTLTVGLKPFTEPNNPYYYAYSIDGGSFIRKQFSDNVVNLPNTNEHIVQIVMDGIGENDPVGGGKWTGQLGIYLTGLTVDAGTIKAIKPLNRKAIFIGDSITEGINVLATGAIGSSNSASNNYAFQASKNLNTVPYMIGYGGTGVTNNASFHKAIDAVNYFYSGVQSDTPKIDYIVMAHGFNDNTLINNGTVTVDQFKTAYNEVLDRMAVKWSGTPIFCVVPFGAQALKPHIESCIASRPYCYLVSSAGWTISTTDGVHPDSAGSKILGKNIATEIEKILTKLYFMN
ncbi:SGNH/GDSL hydrolase family protein [Streptococcus uberis]|uniref:SGNH/GDSL hydrolase family protein n=1 Tax=Streptococcus uberis TaxID=1349 RepID=UPI0006203D0D|nr:hypothetical protein [Streptococcus uberis]KKF59455.1 hypothetical protein AF58_01740 [Streptococcus uberis C6344]